MARDRGDDEMSDRSTPEARLRAVAFGRVQGVNYRDYAIRAARQLGLTGWVANRRDGAVETVAEGDRQYLARFKASMARGSPASTVDRIEASWDELPTGEFTTYSVRYL